MVSLLLAQTFRAAETSVTICTAIDGAWLGTLEAGSCCESVILFPMGMESIREISRLKPVSFQMGIFVIAIGRTTLNLRGSIDWKKHER